MIYSPRLGIYRMMDQMILWAGGRQLGWFDDFADFRANCKRYLRVRTAILPAALRA